MVMFSFLFHKQDDLTVFGVALMGRGHLSCLFRNLRLQKEMLDTGCEEAASETV